MNTKPKNDRRWLPYFVGLLIASLILIFTAINYRSHLYYQYLVTYHDFGNVPTVKLQPIPSLEPPADWVKITEGNVEFWLPPDIASVRNVDEGGVGGILYGDPDSDVTRIAAMLNPEPRLVTDTPESANFPWKATSLRQIVTIYETNPSDFRWSMSSEEIATHVYQVGMAGMVNPGIESPAETRFEEKLDGLLLVMPGNDGRATFQWESRTCPWKGLFLFRDTTGNLDRQWVRTVCASVRFRCDPDEAD